MPKELNQKAVELFNKEKDIEKQLKAYYDIRDLMTKLLTAYQKAIADKANEVQNIIEKINGN